MIKLYGTTHLMSREAIEGIIEHESPDVIGVELCETRLNIMVKNPLTQENSKQDDSIIGKISSAIKKKAEEQNIQYGSDMITASRYALNKNIPLLCIDMDINIIRELMNKIPSNEQAGFLKELAEFDNKELTSEVDAEKTLNELKSRYPIAFEFLITMREQYIENKILRAIIKYPDKKIVIFVGKGHLKSLEDKINSIW